MDIRETDKLSKITRPQISAEENWLLINPDYPSIFDKVLNNY